MLSSIEYEISEDEMLVRVTNPAGAHTPVSVAFLTVSEHVDVKDLSDRNIQSYLDESAEYVSERGLEVETRILRGSPGLGIVELAQEKSGSMVMMTSHGRSGFKRLVRGSVTDTVIRHSEDPLVVIPFLPN